MNSDKLYRINEASFNLFIMISYVLIAMTYFGFFNSATTYLDTLNNYANIYICLFLIWRFNPFRKIDTFTDLDRKVAFSAGIFIITTTVINQYINMLNNKIKQVISTDIIKM